MVHTVLLSAVVARNERGFLLSTEEVLAYVFKYGLESYLEDRELICVAFIRLTDEGSAAERDKRLLGIFGYSKVSASIPNWAAPE